MKGEGLAVVGEDLLPRVIHDPELDLSSTGEVATHAVFRSKHKVKVVGLCDGTTGVVVDGIGAPQLCSAFPVHQDHITWVTAVLDTRILFDININF